MSFGWSQETESSGWRKVSCTAREADDDVRRVLASWLSSEDMAKAVLDRKPAWPVVFNTLETECQFQVLSAAVKFTDAESVRKDLERVTTRRAQLIAFFTKMLESGG